MKKILVAFAAGSVFGVLGAIYAAFVALMEIEPLRIAAKDIVADVVTNTVETTLYGNQSSRRHYSRPRRPVAYQNFVEDRLASADDRRSS